MCHFTNSCVYNVALLKEILTICIFHEFHITTDCFDKTHDICIFFFGFANGMFIKQNFFVGISS